MSLLRYPPFEAARTLFETAAGASVDSPPLLPHLEELLELAQTHQAVLLHLHLPSPPVASLKEASLAQFQTIAALYDLHCRPLFHVTHGPATTQALLYAEMVRSVLGQADVEKSFENRNARDYLRPLKTTLYRITEQCQQELVRPWALTGFSRDCGDYLRDLAFAIYRLENGRVQA